MDVDAQRIRFRDRIAYLPMQVFDSLSFNVSRMTVANHADESLLRRAAITKAQGIQGQ